MSLFHYEDNWDDWLRDKALTNLYIKGNEEPTRKEIDNEIERIIDGEDDEA